MLRSIHEGVGEHRYILSLTHVVYWACKYVLGQIRITIECVYSKKLSMAQRVARYLQENHLAGPSG